MQAVQLALFSDQELNELKARRPRLSFYQRKTKTPRLLPVPDNVIITHVLFYEYDKTGKKIKYPWTELKKNEGFLLRGYHHSTIRFRGKLGAGRDSVELKTGVRPVFYTRKTPNGIVCWRAL